MSHALWVTRLSVIVSALSFVAPVRAEDLASAPPAAESPAVAAPAETKAPSAPEPVAPVVARAEPALGTVRFVSDDGRAILLFERKEKQKEWLTVCASPCSFVAAAGPRDYAVPAKLGPPSAGTRVAAQDLWLRAGDELQAKPKDRRLVRRVGAGLLTAGLLMFAFSPLVLGGPHEQAAFVGLTVSAAAFSVAGLIAVLMRDRVTLTRCAGCYPKGVPAPSR